MSTLPTPDKMILPMIDAVPAPVDVSWSFPQVAAADWSGLTCAGLDGEGRFQPSLGCFLLRIDGRAVMVDTGIGPGPNRYLGGLYGSLTVGLEMAGVRPDEIDLVVFTHLHMDHIGWTMGPEGPFFPKARHVAPAADLAHFEAGAPGMGEHHLIAYETCLKPLVEAGRVEALEDGARIADRIRYLPTPGHTPGHQSVLIDTGRDTIAVAGDVFHCPAQVERPAWSHRADHDAETARASREAFLARAADEDWRIGAGHFRDGLQLGRIARDGGGYVYRPGTG
ncbi:MBL fold metallo-hydrolase [Marinibacterium profundimaris]|uniref:MBL fold metallo-hydrolase n=1 Tax=Marinibacterium profundimaris TaxID=1679460 RepID=UPI00117F5192|nr:MBL fold metallo-hydrolase [Marinibacterium profundimaris]